MTLHPSLGLSIAKGIVEGHGGDIWDESVRGAGSVFSFTLPASSRLAEAGERGDGLATEVVERSQVLLIDDDSVLRAPSSASSSKRHAVTRRWPGILVVLLSNERATHKNFKLFPLTQCVEKPIAPAELMKALVNHARGGLLS